MEEGNSTSTTSAEGQPLPPPPLPAGVKVQKRLIKVTNTKCCVLGCSNKLGNKEMKFYMFPTQMTSQRESWINAVKEAARRSFPQIGDDDPAFAKLGEPGTFICSSHFLNGEVSLDIEAVNYVPTYFPTNNQEGAKVKTEINPLPIPVSTPSTSPVMTVQSRKVVVKKREPKPPKSPAPKKVAIPPYRNEPPKICEVVGCYNITSNKEIRFHYFPPTGSTQRSLWIKLMDRMNWSCVKDSLICEKHFFIHGAPISDNPYDPMYAPIYFPHNRRIKNELTSAMKQQRLELLNNPEPILESIEKMMEKLRAENRKRSNRGDVGAKIVAKDWKLMMRSFIQDCQVRDLFTDITITNGVESFRAHKMLLSSACMLKNIIGSKHPLTKNLQYIPGLIHDSLMFATDDTDVIVIPWLANIELKCLKHKIYGEPDSGLFSDGEEEEYEEENDENEAENDNPVEMEIQEQPEIERVVELTNAESRSLLKNKISTGQFFKKFNNLCGLMKPNQHPLNTANLKFVPSSSSLPSTAIPCDGPPSCKSQQMIKASIPSSIDQSTTDAIIKKVSKMRAIEPVKISVPQKPGSEKKVTIIVQTLKKSGEFATKKKKKVKKRKIMFETSDATCDACKGTFNSVKELKDHQVRYVFDPNPFDYKCILCDEMFNFNEEKLMHYKNEHPDREVLNSTLLFNNTNSQFNIFFLVESVEMLCL